jgi:anaerobic selenocysteine-containing dehydrogenase
MSTSEAIAATASTTKHTFCRVCHASCPMEIDVVDNRVTAVRGVLEDPLFEGYTCIKGRQYPDQMSNPDRLRAPLRRRPDGTFEHVTTSEALDGIATDLRRIIDTYGPRAVASYTGTGGYQNSLAVPVARSFHQGIDSPSFYTSVTIDQPAKTTAPFRVGIWEAGYHNFSDADVSLAIGYNPMVSSYGAVGGLQGTNPFVVMRRKKADGMKLIVVDPRRTELASFADIHLQVRPGEDAALLAGLVNVILAEHLHDAAFCDQWVDELDELRLAVEPFTAEYVAARCDVPADDIVAAARMFAAGPRGTAGTGTGPNMAPHSSLTEHLTIVLNTICGRVNREGDRIESGWFLYPDTPKRAQVIAPRPPATGALSRIRELRGYRGEMPTAALAEEILTPGDGRVRALVVSGGNPVVAWPDQELTLQAMEDLELLVVIDHRMSATAEHADYVLASTLSLERADVPHLMDRWFRAPYTNYTDAVLERDGDVLNEWEVFWELARRLGSALPLPGGPAPMDIKPTDDDMIDLVYAGSRMPLDEVRAHRGTVHPDRAMVVQPADPDATARFRVAPADLMSELADVRRERTGAEVLAGFDAARYPYRLVSRRLKHALNSLGPELPGLARKGGTTNRAYVNPVDAQELGVVDGDLIEITSPRASLIGVVETAPDVRRGVVSMAHSWGGSSLGDEKVRDIGAPTNRLVSTTDGYDVVTGMVIQSAIPVALRPVDDPHVRHVDDPATEQRH